jgi:hypothetical protein
MRADHRRCQAEKPLIVLSRFPEPALFIQTLALLDKKIRGWGDAFGSTTQRVIFVQMDDQLDRIIADFIQWFGRHTKGLDRKVRLRKMGVALLIDTLRSH